MRKFEIDKSIIYIGESYRNLPKYLPSAQVVLITDENVYKNYKTFIDEYTTIVIPSGEKNKSLATVESIVKKLLNLDVDRNTFLIGFGGGVITDITGFVASIYMRGVKFGFVSTTLLAQVDASLGGKNGVNFNTFKNILGTFNSPEFVICDPTFLSTLEEKQIRSGFGEIIKHALINDKILFDYLNSNSQSLLELNKKDIEYVVWKAINTKAKFVNSDWKEQGERKMLNFGHTYGHAIESMSKYTHGEAITIGMIWAARWSVNKGLLDKSIYEKIKSLIIKFKLPYEYKNDVKKIGNNISKDKKKNGNSLDFVYLKDIGEAILQRISMRELIKELEDESLG